MVDHNIIEPWRMLKFQNWTIYIYIYKDDMSKIKRKLNRKTPNINFWIDMLNKFLISIPQSNICPWSLFLLLVTTSSSPETIDLESKLEHRRTNKE